jgi:Plasmid pRiA4b ORF-3-like protein
VFPDHPGVGGSASASRPRDHPPLLHHTIQAATGWENSHLHTFTIRGRECGIDYEDGVSFADNALQVRLKDFGFRIEERLYYEYGFGDGWEHELLIEAAGKAPRPHPEGRSV